MTEFPPPFTAADCDLRGMEWMPLFGARLFMSDFEARASDIEFRAAVRLWWMAWQQVPAASLPDDNAVLCRLAGLGRDIKTWLKVREAALHGFTICSDGRFYHRLLSVQAMEAWDRRVKDRDRKAAYRARKSNGSSDGGQEDNKRPQDNGQDCGGTSATCPTGQNVGGDSDVRIDRTRQDRTGPDRTGHSPKPPLPGGRALGSDSDPDFVAFWEAYPRKDDKGHARNAWKTAIRSAKPAEIVAGCRGYRFDPNPKFQPLPATWLRGERWLQVADSDGMDPVLKAAGVTQAMLDEYLGTANDTPIFKGKLIQ